jgi:large subunit ribosomal protein L21
MYVIFEHKNKQYKVSEGDTLKIPRSEGLKKDDVLSFDNIVLLKNSNDQVQIGTPVIKGVSVKAKVIDQIRDKKIIVFKKKRRHNYRRKIGHRQDLTLVKIENIISSSTPKKSIPESSNKNVKKGVSDGS